MPSKSLELSPVIHSVLPIERGDERGDTFINVRLAFRQRGRRQRAFIAFVSF